MIPSYLGRPCKRALFVLNRLLCWSTLSGNCLTTKTAGDTTVLLQYEFCICCHLNAALSEKIRHDSTAADQQINLQIAKK